MTVKSHYLIIAEDEYDYIDASVSLTEEEARIQAKEEAKKRPGKRFILFRAEEYAVCEDVPISFYTADSLNFDELKKNRKEEEGFVSVARHVPEGRERVGAARGYHTPYFEPARPVDVPNTVQFFNTVGRLQEFTYDGTERIAGLGVPTLERARELLNNANVPEDIITNEVPF